MGRDGCAGIVGRDQGLAARNTNTYLTTASILISRPFIDGISSLMGVQSKPPRKNTRQADENVACILLR